MLPCKQEITMTSIEIEKNLTGDSPFCKATTRTQTRIFMSVKGVALFVFLLFAQPLNAGDSCQVLPQGRWVFNGLDIKFCFYFNAREVCTTLPIENYLDYMEKAPKARLLNSRSWFVL